MDQGLSNSAPQESKTGPSTHDQQLPLETVDEKRKRYEGSVFEALMKAAGHEICPRCYCCDLVPESAPCPVCGGFCGPEYDDGWDDGYCDYCGDDGEIYFMQCIGRCDENGNHKHSQEQAR